MRILIAGLSKTGTTALLYLVKNALPENTKVVFEPEQCPPAWGTESDLPVIAKVLIGKNLDAASFRHFDKKVTIVRDVRDRHVSALLYSQFHASYLADSERVGWVRDCLRRKEARPSAVSMREVQETMWRAADAPEQGRNQSRAIGHQLTHYDRYHEAMPDAFVYKYEDFVEGRYAALEQYLGVPLSGAAVVPDRLERVKRTMSHGDWRNWFTPADIEELAPLMRPYLERYGYDVDDWRLNDPPRISAEHCSGYFARLVEERHRKQRAAEASTQRGAHKQPALPVQRARRGQLLAAEPSRVVGWAIGADAQRTVKVELLVNGERRAEAVADVLRPGLCKRGLHPTGRCGFAFRFGPGHRLEAGDVVRVRTVETQCDLNNSPCVVVESLASVRLTARDGKAPSRVAG